jgi:serine protease
MTGNGEHKKRSSLIWILVLIAVLIAWWFLRGLDDDEVSRSEIETDRVAALDRDYDEILVDLRDDATDATVAAIERDLGIDLVLVSDQSLDERFYRASVDPAEQDAILRALRARPEVEIAEPDATVNLAPGAPVRLDVADAEWQGFPNDPQYKFQWHLDQIKMPAAWKLADGDGVVVAVLDTGVAYEDRGRFHRVPDLAGVEFVKPYNFVSNNGQANDDHGHGTHVTGTIAQATHNGIGVAGVARAVQIMPLKVLSASGSGSVGGIADAIRFAADEGAKVINMSLGSRFPSRVLEKAVNYAHSKGVTVVCAAGNDGRGKIGYPAAYDKAVAVAATQYDESTTFYSNWGKGLDVAAPGGNTRVDQNNDGMPDGVLQNTIVIGDPTKSDYFGYMGTSMASPHAAAVAALIVGEGVTNPDAVERMLEDTARAPKSQKLDSNRYGAGIVDAEAAVLAARSDTGAGATFFALLFAAGLALTARRRGLLGLAAGATAGAGGLFFLPKISGWLATLPGVEMLTRGLPSWDLALLGVEGHGNPLFFSALIPMGLLALLWGVARLRPVLAGVLVGVAGHLVYHAATGIADIRYVPEAFGLETLWLLGNAALCVVLARLAWKR